MPSSESGRHPNVVLLLLGLAMLVFGLLQLNDPDPAIWLGYYAVVAAACTVGAYRPMPALLFWLPVAASAVGAVLTLPGFVDWLLNRPASDLWAAMSADRVYIEHSREFLGLLIALTVLVTARRLSRARSPERRRSS